MYRTNEENSEFPATEMKNHGAYDETSFAVEKRGRTFASDRLVAERTAWSMNIKILRTQRAGCCELPRWNDNAVAIAEDPRQAGIIPTFFSQGRRMEID